MDNREIDTLIAEKVMGWKLNYEFADSMGVPVVPHLRDQYDEWGLLPEFSTDISAAWQVVEKINSIKMDTEEGYQIRAKFILSQDVKHFLTFSAQQAALTICLAALKAVGVDYNHYTEQLKGE